MTNDRETSRRRCRPRVAASLIALALAVPAAGEAVGAVFRTRLTTAPFEPQERTFKGDGSVVATISGDMLRLRGSFEGLDAPVTRIRLRSGAAVGMRGGVEIAELAMPAARTSGTIEGMVRLDRNQLRLLKGNRIYVQLETSVAPGGALIGWLTPDHPFPGEDVPEKQDWSIR